MPVVFEGNPIPISSIKGENGLNPLQKNIALWLVISLVFVMVYHLFNQPKTAQTEIIYSDFLSYVDKSQVAEVTIQGENISGRLTSGTLFKTYAPKDAGVIPLLKDKGVRISAKPADDSPWYMTLLVSWLPMLLLIGVWIFFMRQMQGGGGKAMAFGKSRARLVTDKSKKVTFADVAGVEEAKAELEEVIDFLRDPKKYTKLGGRIPKGLLLVGQPGTGKTLLARAIAGEADVPFLSISGSDFVEMFVGVGASRVRDLFNQGKKNAPCIIFIDEIDAVGRLRFSGIGGGNDEREQTLNQLLVEMDGFDGQQGLILIAATNRPDTLDPALLRPGRFDRTIIINLPDILGREEILKVHTRKIKLAESVNLKSVASQTPGFSGADLANLCNEAALMAARNNKEAVEEIDLDKSVERVLMGPEKKSHIMSKKEKEITSLHESGHALLSLLLPEVNPLKKVSIIPRGLAGGYTFTPPLEDRHYWTKKELLAEITMILGGRASEYLNLGEVTTGAQNDLEVATGMARRMVTQFGMSERLGNLTLGRREGLVFLGRDIMEEKNYSDQTAHIIDEEVKQIIDDAYNKAIEMLKNNQDKLKLLSMSLLEKEVLSGEEVKKILGIEKSDLV